MEGGLTDPVPNESFDALIDLLGSDDVVNDPRFGNHFDDGLRDADGKLPFNKIHAFFSGAQSDHPVPLLSSDIFPPQSEMGTTNEHNIVRLHTTATSLVFLSHAIPDSIGWTIPLRRHLHGQDRPNHTQIFRPISLLPFQIYHDPII